MVGVCPVQDERGLIERAQKNDSEALAEIYEANFDKIYRYIFFRVGNQAEAEDLTQQVFFNAVRSISSYKWRGAPFSSWLFRIAHNQVIDYYRKASKTQSATLDLPMAAADPDPVSIAEQEMDMEQVKGAIGSLTQLQQEVITLRFAGELSTAETARLMGKSEGAVKALQHSALAALRKRLSEERNHGQEV
jgi:RNA polymerase sigma-70 factor (ECF subfamily)